MHPSEQEAVAAWLQQQEIRRAELAGASSSSAPTTEAGAEVEEGPGADGAGDSEPSAEEPEAKRRRRSE